MTWRWPWQREPPADLDRAKRALMEAQQERKDVEAKWDEVDQITGELRRHYRENNFSKLVDEAMHLRRRAG